jgi:hypothetical protein
MAGSVGAAGLASNNGVLVRGFLSRHDKVSLMPVFIDLAGVSSSGRLHQQTPWTTCLIVGSDGIHSCAIMFFLTVRFQRERCEALQSFFHCGTCL